MITPFARARACVGHTFHPCPVARCSPPALLLLLLLLLSRELTAACRPRASLDAAAQRHRRGGQTVRAGSFCAHVRLSNRLPVLHKAARHAAEPGLYTRGRAAVRGQPRQRGARVGPPHAARDGGGSGGGRGGPRELGVQARGGDSRAARTSAPLARWRADRSVLASCPISAAQTLEHSEIDASRHSAFDTRDSAPDTAEAASASKDSLTLSLPVPSSSAPDIAPAPARASAEAIAVRRHKKGDLKYSAAVRFAGGGGSCTCVRVIIRSGRSRSTTSRNWRWRASRAACRC